MTDSFLATAAIGCVADAVAAAAFDTVCEAVESASVAVYEAAPAIFFFQKWPDSRV